MDYSEIDEIVAEAKARNIDPDALAETLDSLLDFEAAIPGPIGIVAERLDGPAFAAVFRALGKRLRLMADPAWRAARKAERAAKREKRIGKKAAKKKASADGEA